MDFEKSSIERLKRTLYSRNEKIVPKEKRTPVSGKETDVSTDWGTPPTLGVIDDTMSKRNNSFFNKFLIGSLVFFFVALAIAAFIFFGGLNMISSNNLDVKIAAPSSVSSGEELVMGLTVVNSNRTDLEQSTLFVNYPEGAQSVGDNKLLSRDQVDLGTIASGGSKDYTVRAVLSGEKDAIKTFTFRIEYKVKGSNAIFSKEKTYNVIISSSPIILNVSYPTEVNSGQDVALSIDIVSNSNTVLQNTLIKIEYPYGFTYKSSNIKPLRDNAVWNLGDLKNGDKKTLSIIGTLVGQNLEDRSFKISAGTLTPGQTDDFDTALATNITTVGIRKSSFDLSVNTDSVASLGQSIPVSIQWQNILPDKILNTSILATISGDILDKASVRVSNGGFYRSTDNTIVWDKNTTPDLASISPGDTGSFSVTFASFPDSAQIRLIKNPHVDIQISSTGDRSGAETGVVSSQENFTIKFPSIFAFTAKSFRGVGPLTNTGPVPPRADKESTYTITWTLTNANNDLKNVIVTAIVPAGVDYKNEVSPQGERINFDSNTRTLSWNVGNLSSGVGFTYSPKTVSFKVGITPSITQVNTTPELLSGLNFSATDTYTGTQLSFQIQSVTTLFSDPGFKTGNDVVQR